MTEKINYNHQHVASGFVISGTEHPITVKDLRDAIAEYPDDTEVVWGSCNQCGTPLTFYRFKDRGSDPKTGSQVLQIDVG